MQFEFGTIYRFVSWLLLTLIVDGLLKNTGRFVCSLFMKNKALSNQWLVVAGCLFWGLVLILIVQVNDFMAVDACLDSGGSYDYDANQCIK